MSFEYIVNLLSIGLSILVALLHFNFLIIEMILWRKRGAKLFRLSQEFVDKATAMAANQGLYNGFLSVGIVWSIATNQSLEVLAFFHGCVIIAGLFGAITVGFKILILQAIPAALALTLVMLRSDFTTNYYSCLVFLLVSVIATIGAALFVNSNIPKKQ